MVGTFQLVSLVRGGSHNAAATILSPLLPLLDGSTMTGMRPPMRKPALKKKWKHARQSAHTCLSMSNSSIYNGNRKKLAWCFWWRSGGILKPSTYLLEIAPIVDKWIMNEGSKAAVDNLVEVIHRSKSEVRVFVLACGWSYGGHVVAINRYVNVSSWATFPKVIIVFKLKPQTSYIGKKRLPFWQPHIWNYLPIYPR